jgi:ribosomal protein L37AE/L43A
MAGKVYDDEYHAMLGDMGDALMAGHRVEIERVGWKQYRLTIGADSDAEAWLRRQINGLGEGGHVMAATVTPIRPDVVIPVTPAKSRFTCPVCLPPTPEEDSTDLVDCDTCGAKLHHECYWGRVASLDEWREYLRWVNETPIDQLGAAPPNPVTCPACRAEEEGA